MRKPDNADVGLREDCEGDLADVGHNANADLYVVNQESTDLIREAHSMGDVSSSLNGTYIPNGNGLSQDLFYFQSLSLD